MSAIFVIPLANCNGTSIPEEMCARSFWPSGFESENSRYFPCGSRNTVGNPDLEVTSCSSKSQYWQYVTNRNISYCK